MVQSMFTRRHFLASFAAGLSATAQTRSLPNIVYILCDDLGYGDPGCYNKDSKTPTPAIDRFARQGMRFTDAHSPSAVCTPTRYGILTGRYCWRTSLKKGVLNGESPSLIEPGRTTVASLLKSKGYETAGLGKWHLGLGNKPKTDYTKPLHPGPLDFGFDSWFGIPASLDMEPYVYVENDHVLEQATGQISQRREQRGIFYRGGAIAPDFKHEEVLPRIRERAVRYLEGRKATTKPFFLYLALTAPHTPWLPTQKFVGKSKAGPYGDFVTMVDDTIGQVLTALDRSGKADNTLVIVTSDNGAHWLPEEIAKWDHRANDGLRGQKADIWDGGHRIPFLARWPGKIAPGSVSNELVCLTDLMATVAEITGTTLPSNAGEDSYSVVPAMLGKRSLRQAIVHHSNGGHFSIRQGNWKLNIGRGSGGFSVPVEYAPKPGEPAGELFDMAADPAETNNMYSQKPEIVAELTALLKTYQQQGHSR